MTQIVGQLLNFQRFLVDEFRERFDDIFDDVLWYLPPQISIYQQNEYRQMTYDKLNSLNCKVGHLQSDILQGLEKFYNKNVHQAQKILYQADIYKELSDMVLEILNRKENYCIRQTLSLEIMLQDYD